MSARFECSRMEREMSVRKDRTSGERDMRARMGKAVGIVILAMAVIVVLAALTLPYFADVNKYHRQVQSQLEKSLGRKVSLVHMDVRFIPPSLHGDNAIIGEDSHFKTGYPFATADRLTVSVRLLPLLRGQIEIKGLELDRPRIELVKNEKGEFNEVKYRTIHAPRIAPLLPDTSQLFQYAGYYYSRELETGYQLSVANNQLILHHMRLGDLSLVPDIAQRDQFSGDVGSVKFTRNQAGAITGFSLSGGRMKHMQFVKQ